VFTDDRGNPIRRQRWNDTWNRAAKAAELPPGTTPHDLRHCYASLLIGASVTAVQTMLRHKTATETLTPTPTCGRRTTLWSAGPSTPS